MKNVRSWGKEVKEHGQGTGAPVSPGATQTKTELIEYGPRLWVPGKREKGAKARQCGGLLLKDLLSFLFGSLQKSKQLNVSTRCWFRGSSLAIGFF